MMICGHAANGVCSGKDGIKYDPPIPSCVICSCIQQEDSPPQLEGRMMRCSYYGNKWGRNSGPIYPKATEACSRDMGCRCEFPSDINQPFFEFKGEFSKSALLNCKNCGFLISAHEYDYEHGTRVSKTPPKGMCDHFDAHGPWDFDGYYCGCSGWD